MMTLVDAFPKFRLESRTSATTALNNIKQEPPMQIRLASVMVNNQETALRFYTTILGFVKNKDIPMGPFRWLTVSSPEGAEGVELVLEPMGFAPAQMYQKALFAAGIPATAFLTSDIESEYQRLKALGVSFRGEPKSMGPITAVLFEDTCGNLINMVQPAA
jgi:catechol 2,3-dioxygenase-like lactoylglutathione lyase family enzyme